MRYLVGFSPYSNGAFLYPLTSQPEDEWMLHCPCQRPSICSRWRWSDLKRYDVCTRAHDRGYGSPDEVVQFGSESQRQAQF
jgi:hypothetical protein